MSFDNKKINSELCDNMLFVTIGLYNLDLKAVVVFHAFVKLQVGQTQFQPMYHTVHIYIISYSISHE